MSSSMRAVINLIENTQTDLAIEDQIERIISQGGFDEEACDSATSGLCGTFALVLYRCLQKRKIPCEIVFICQSDPKGDPLFTSSRDRGDIRALCWTHVAIKAGSSYFDIEGKVTLPDMIDNYCRGRNGVALPATFKEAATILRSTKHSYDRSKRNAWAKSLA